MIFEFSHFELPDIENKLSGEKYEELKRSIVTLLMSQRARVFNDESSPDGHWAPLGSSQQARRDGKLKDIQAARLAALKKKGFNLTKILQDTGLLRESFTDTSGPGNAYRKVETSGDEVSLSTAVTYAAIQNFGGTIHHPGTSNGFGRGVQIPAYNITIPDRPFDQFSDQDELEIKQLIAGYLNDE